MVLGACVAFAAGPFVPARSARAGDDAAKAAAREEVLRREPWLALTHTTRSRKEIRDRLVAWVSDQSDQPGVGNGFGTTPPNVSEWIPILDRMIAEDAAHPSPTRPLAELPADERIAELIYRLRDIRNASALWDSGRPDSHTPPVFGEPTAADLLIREGLAAVPALIATLGDERLTRCFRNLPGGTPHPQYTHRWEVMRVGEVASMLLTRIAGRPFRPTAAATGQIRDFGASLRPAVQAWWDAVQEKGEFLATADELQSVTIAYQDVYLSRCIAKLDPHAASPIVVRVARATSDPMRRKLLLDLLDGLHGPGVAEFLRHELEHSPILLHRVAAAFSLRDRGEDERATAGVQAAWRDFGEWPEALWAQEQAKLGFHQAAVFLVSSKNPEVLADLGRGLGERPAAARAAVAQALAGGPDKYGEAAYFSRYRHDSGVPGIDDGVARALLRPLLDDLDDLDMGIVYLTPGRSMPWDTRVADMAAASLARREPGTYEFKAVAPRAARNVAIALIRTFLDQSVKR